MPAAFRRDFSHTGDGPDRDVPEEPADVARTAFEVVDGDVHGLGSRRLGIDPGRRRELEVVERRHLARDAVHREQVGAVAGRLDEEHVVREREHVGERRPGLGLGQHHDPRVVGAELDLVLGQDHPVRELAANLALVELQPAREDRAGQRDGHGRARAEVPGAADDLARLALPHVDPAQLEPVGVRVLLGRDHLADAEEAEVPVLVGDAAALDALDLGGRDREPRRELVERHLDRDVVPQPGDRDSQNCLSTRRSPSQSGRMSGKSYLSCATRSIPQPNAKPDHSLVVDADVREDARVDHACAAHLEPAGVLAGAAACAAADPAGDVGLDRGLGEREVVRAETDAPVRPVERAHHVQERPLEVGERQPAVDGEALELVEDRVVRRVDRVAPVAAPDRDHVDRRLALLHRVDLRRRRLRAQDVRLVEEERRAVRARRMPRVEGELVEVVLGRLHLAVVAHLVAEAEERVLDLAARLGDRVQVPEWERVAGEGHVDDVLGQRAVELGALELRLAGRDRLLDRLARRVQGHARLAVAHLAERELQVARAAEVADAQLVELARRSRQPRSRSGPRAGAPQRPRARLYRLHGSKAPTPC